MFGWIFFFYFSIPDADFFATLIIFFVGSLYCWTNKRKGVGCISGQKLLLAAETPAFSKVIPAFGGAVEKLLLGRLARDIGLISLNG